MWCTYVTCSNVGLYYIGKARVENIRTGYQGSGSGLKQAKELFGGKWMTDVIQTFDNEDDAYDHEEQLVTHETMSDPMCLNRLPGGSGRSTWNGTGEWCDKGQWQNWTPEQRSKAMAKAAEKNRGRKRTEEQRLRIVAGVIEASNKPEVKAKHRELSKKFWATVTPEQRAVMCARMSASAKARHAKARQDKKEKSNG